MSDITSTNWRSHTTTVRQFTSSETTENNNNNNNNATFSSSSDDNNSNNTHQTRRVIRTSSSGAAPPSSSSSTWTTPVHDGGGSGSNDQQQQQQQGLQQASFTERGRIMSRYHRRVTLSPSPDDEGGQAFGWGTTLVSTLHGAGGGDDGGDDDSAQEDQDGDDHIEWRYFSQKGLERGTTTTGRPPLVITGSEVVPGSRQPHQVSHSNEISTLRYYYNDAHYDGHASGREGLGLGIQARGERELSPPVRHPHRSLSVDRRNSSYNSGWGAGSSTNNNNNNIVVTTTTSTTSTPAANRPRTTTWTGGDGSNSNSSRTIRYYDPDVLRWHGKADEESSSSPLPTASPISQYQGQPAHHNKNVNTGTTTFRGNSSNDNDDNNTIEEVVRAIHASRTGPFPGLSHGHRGLGVGGGGAGNGTSNESPSASSSVYEEELLLSGGQGLGRGGHTTTTAVSNGSGGNNNSRIPRLPNPPASFELNKHNNKPLAIFNNNSSSQQTSGSTTTAAGARTATHRQSQETNRDTFGSRQTSSGQRSVISHNNNGESSHLQPPRSVEHVEQQQTRPVSHLPRLIVTEGGGSGASHHTAQANTANATTNNNNKQDTHHQGERAIRRTSITRIPGANLVDVPRRGSDVGKSTDSCRLSTSRSDFPYQDRTTELGGGQGGFFAPSANNSNGLQQSHASSSVAENSGIRDPRKTTQVGAASAGTEGGTSNQKKTTATTTKEGRGTTGILTAAHAASPRESNASHSPRDFAVAHTAKTTSSGDNKGPSNTQIRPHSLPAQHQHSDVDKTTTTAGVPPASTHHGQHALFTNLPEPEKAHYPETRGLGYRFREASLSTVGSIFKPEQRRQSSVTVLGDDADPQPVNAERYRDEAWDFLLRYRTERIVDVGRQPSYLRRLRWRIDLHLMVLLFLAYLVTFLDKILFNYARVMGILAELDFTANDFANASSYFYVASFAFSLPYVWLLTKVPLAKLLAVDLVGWGICTATHAALRNYGGLVALRVLSGVFEAGILPCLILLTGQYFTWKEQPIRFAYWTSGVAVGQMLSGLLSWAFQHMSPRAHLSSWQTMYLVLGDLTIVLGFVIFFLVPDTPMKARFLNNEEKVALLEHIKVNQTGVSHRRFHPKQVAEGVLDVGCWLLGIMVVLQLISSGVTMFYSVSMLNGFGYSAERSALLNMPPGAINLVCIFLYAIYVRYWGMRWVVVCFAGIVSTVGAALLFGLTSYGDNRRALLAGLYLINFAPGATMIVVYWVSCNVAGHTKRAYAAAAMNAAYALGAIIGPQMFRHQAVPGYRSAKMTLVITMAVTVALAPLAAVYFWYMNRARVGKHEGLRPHEGDVDDATAYGGLTDKQNKAFRYRS